MTFEHIALLRNIGQFDSVNAGSQIYLTPISLIYAENGRGKTTIAAILRSLSTGNVELINERHRLGAQHSPHIVLTDSSSSIVFQNGAWSVTKPEITIFDDVFVTKNVCSGIEIEAAHRQNLHELILGAQGVALNAELQGYIARIEQHNLALRSKQDDIPTAARGRLTANQFCALKQDQDIDAKVLEAERRLSAARSADVIRQRSGFRGLSLPDFDIGALNAILSRSLPDLQAAAAEQVQAHIRGLGPSGESWVAEGVQLIARPSAEDSHEICPFCAQDLQSSPLIEHYQTYFSDAYKALKTDIQAAIDNLNSVHGADIPAAFERAVREAAQSHEFWKDFANVPKIDVDTAAISRVWTAAREAVLAELHAKAAAPLESMTLSHDAITRIDTYRNHRTEIEQLSTAMLACNQAIDLIKEQAADANVAALTTDLDSLRAKKARYEPDIAALCDNFLIEKTAKTETERLRDECRVRLDNYRQNVFPSYKDSINEYLRRFNAGFRIENVESVNRREGSSVNYSVIINNQSISLTSDRGPSFRNTLSSGDRNTLALAFFFASLDQDPELSRKVIVIDDPMTSLDEHRSLATIQEMRRLSSRVSQMVVLSHSKPFLCAIWEGTDTNVRSAMRIFRDGDGSNLASWNVNDDCVTEHDHRHARVMGYIQSANSAMERAVAADLRPILEAFLRVAYPGAFPPGTLLGRFIEICRQRHGRPDQILSTTDTTELRALLDYANRFHHDTNPAWETAAINDSELFGFAQRTVNFCSRAH